jgi:hypothetical protein
VRDMGRYLVTGKRAYREHEPGTVFEAHIPWGPEQRAINRGSIRLLERMVADLPPGRYRLPLGWPTYTTARTEG